MKVTDLKTQICSETRRSTVDKIADTCKKFVPSSEHHAASKINEIALRFEERIYSTATSQDDYLKLVSKKMLIMEGKFQNTKPNSLGSNPQPIDDIGLDPGLTKTQVTNSSIQFGPEYRGKVVNKIVDVLRKRVPFSHEHLLSEIKNIALRFEERIYSHATSQVDYLRKISVKMLTLQKTSQDALSNLSGSKSVASQSIQSQLNIQKRPTSLSAKHSQAHQQKVLHKGPDGTASPGVQGSSSLPSARPCSNGTSPTHTATVSAKNFNQQEERGISQRSVGITVARGTSPNISVNHEKLLQQDQQQDLTLHGSSCQQQLPQVLKLFKKGCVRGSMQTNTEQGQLQNQLEQTLSQPSEKPQQSDCVLHNSFPLMQTLHLMRQQNQLIGRQGNVNIEQQHGQRPESCNSCKQQDEAASKNHSQHTQPYLQEVQFLSQLQAGNLEQSPNPSQYSMQSTLQTSVLASASVKGQESPEQEKEEVHAKVEHIKTKYFPKLNEMFKLTTAELQCYGLFSEEQSPDHVEKLKEIRQLIGIYLFLNKPQNMMDKAYKERLGSVEHTIIFLLKAFCRRKLGSSLHQGQVPSTPQQLQEPHVPEQQPIETSYAAETMH